MKAIRNLGPHPGNNKYVVFASISCLDLLNLSPEIDLQGTIGHSEEEPQTLWGALHPPLPKPHRSTTVSLGIWRATLACPTFPSLPESQYFLQDQSPCKSHTPSCLHFPHRTYHLLFLSLQNLVLFIALSQLHKNSAWITVVTQ